MYNEIDAHSIELYIGEVRSGKTLCMTADTYLDLQKVDRDIKVFSNYTLNPKFFKNTELITKNDLIEYHNHKVEFKKCIFLIDELQQWLDNREFMKKGNKAISYFFGQMGKRGNVLRGTVHDYSLIDIRGRLYTQNLSYVFKGLIDDKGKWKQLLNVNRELSDEENETLYIQKVTYIKKLVKTSFLPEFKYVKMQPKFIKAKDFFHMYDTEELIVTDYDDDEPDKED